MVNDHKSLILSFWGHDRPNVPGVKLSAGRCCSVCCLSVMDRHPLEQSNKHRAPLYADGVPVHSMSVTHSSEYRRSNTSLAPASATPLGYMEYKILVTLPDPPSLLSTSCWEHRVSVASPRGRCSRRPSDRSDAGVCPPTQHTIGSNNRLTFHMVII